MATRSNIFDKIIFDSFQLTPESLGLYRILYALFLLIFGVPNFTWISRFPDVFYNPPLLSLHTFFSGFPSYWFLLLVSLGTCISTVLLLFGYKTRLTSILLALFIFTGKSFAYSFGKIDHDFLIWIIPLVMSFSNWGAAYSLDAKLKHQDRVVQNWPVVLLALILSFAMFSAGLPKLLGGWLDISTHAVRGHFLREFYVNERQDLLAPFFLNLNSALVWEFFDYAGVFLEVFFIFAIIRPNLFRFFVICAIFFHVFNYLMLNIAFSINIILYLLFVDWGMIISKLRKHRMLLSIERAINFRSLLIVGLLYTSFYLIYITATESVTFNVSPLRFVLEDLMNLDSLIFSGIVIFLGLIVAVLNLIHFVSKKKDFSDSTIPKYMHN
ncbi:hypothetical protein DXT99_02520 [Pontibacter diazotrophicus]|uniref:HTTM-like domain-containing protein n=2 Tax=Pontibacter diazotrophicus TaxID=1400979 RepID=A0A3D8LH60_9BACT|nr:HTTM domain-containing protein [Pontibacter diazotrophicus]RDV16676.1 hypothetical protein DXT99_02520 [Pontibacter diazotrophicus]